MRLTEEEIGKIEESLAILKKKFASQVDEVISSAPVAEKLGDKKSAIDTSAVQKLADSYLTVDGFANLLLDAGMLSKDATRDCGCAGPCYYSSVHCVGEWKNPRKGVSV
jgi:hypothetical protein